MEQLLEEIRSKEELLAIIIRSEYDKPGISFFTSSDNILQVGYMNYQEEKSIQPHIHNRYKREIYGTQEVIFIKKGKVKVSFYNQNKEFVSDRKLYTGDCVALIDGGHGFELLEPTKMIEVKNGPYAHDQDKIRF
mgnify:FL=1